MLNKPEPQNYTAVITVTVHAVATDAEAAGACLASYAEWLQSEEGIAGCSAAQVSAVAVADGEPPVEPIDCDEES